MKKHYKLVLIVLVFLLITMITTGVGVSYAYYRTSVTGAVSNKTSDYACDIQVVSETHTIVPASNTAVDEIKFYVKNYTGTDTSPTNTSEVYLSYTLSFTLPTWASGCTNPVSYKLYAVNESNNSETEVTLSNNKTSQIDFSLISAERDYYKLKLYWNMNYNSDTCYAGMSKNVGISADIYQTPSRYSA